MEALLLILCLTLFVAGIATAVTGVKRVPREPAELPPAQLVLDGRHDLGVARSSRISVRRERLAVGGLLLVAAVIAGVVMVIYSLEHMTLGSTGSFFPGN